MHGVSFQSSLISFQPPPTPPLNPPTVGLSDLIHSANAYYIASGSNEIPNINMHVHDWSPDGWGSRDSGWVGLPNTSPDFSVLTSPSQNKMVDTVTAPPPHPMSPSTDIPMKSTLHSANTQIGNPLHKSSVFVEAPPPQQSTFTQTLPLDHVEQASQTEWPAALPGVSQEDGGPGKHAVCS